MVIPGLFHLHARNARGRFMIKHISDLQGYVKEQHINKLKIELGDEFDELFYVSKAKCF
jgi:hypothetical protein